MKRENRGPFGKGAAPTSLSLWAGYQELLLCSLNSSHTTLPACICVLVLSLRLVILPSPDPTVLPALSISVFIQCTGCCVTQGVAQTPRQTHARCVRRCALTLLGEAGKGAQDSSV